MILLMIRILLVDAWNSRLALSLLILLILSGSLSTLFAQPAELLVAAASDLSSIQSLLADGFAAPVRFTFGSSGMLTRQIENGAPFDVFLSASEEFTDQLLKKNRIDRDSRRVYAIGRLALWSSLGSFRTAADLRRARVIAIANPQHAPYGKAAMQALFQLGLAGELKDRIVFAENVRQALQFAESGNADVAITAWSFVYNRDGVLLPEELHAPLRQIGAVVNKTKNRKQAQAFLDFLVSEKGRALFAQNGFNLLPAAPSLKR
jgi:molybdate transport system substrate-binding protein